ncbi:hypothetical protein J7M28_08805 [bacterium]|nr:hypothetical protein [bacterium]
MSAKVNFILKTTDAKAGQVKKALTEAGIEVRAVVEVYREQEPDGASESVDDSPAASK